MELKLFIYQRSSENGFRLLIVPYGIETEFLESSQNVQNTFNRTLWN